MSMVPCFCAGCRGAASQHPGLLDAAGARGARKTVPRQVSHHQQAGGHVQQSSSAGEGS